MRKIIIGSFLLMVFSFNAICQTTITGFIPSAVNHSKKIVLSVYDNKSISDRKIFEDTINTDNGKFEFNFKISGINTVAIELDGDNIFFPGTYNILVESRDSINIGIPNEQKLGIANLVFSGRGAEKIEFHKSIITKVLDLYKSDPDYQKQTLLYKFQSTDKKLNAIDSIYSGYIGNLNENVKDIIRADNQSAIMKMLFISSMRSKEDSLSTYFQEFIVNRDRIKPIVTGNAITFSGSSLLYNFILLKQFKNPVFLGDNYEENHILDFAKLVVRYFNTYPQVKDFLLSNLVISFSHGKIYNDELENLLLYYSKQVKQSSPYFSETIKTVEKTKKLLQAGQPFFDFSLADDKGKIHTLSDFKGKILIFDFWFTGCSGCKQMAPVLNTLEEKLAKKGIQFISVNTDTKKWWLEGIGQYSSASSLQLYTMEQKFKHPLIKFLNIAAYPALFVVDKEGNIVGVPPDPRVNEEGFINYMERLL